MVYHMPPIRIFSYVKQYTSNTASLNFLAAGGKCPYTERSSAESDIYFN